MHFSPTQTQKKKNNNNSYLLAGGGKSIGGTLGNYYKINIQLIAVCLQANDWENVRSRAHQTILGEEILIQYIQITNAFMIPYEIEPQTHTHIDSVEAPIKMKKGPTLRRKTIWIDARKENEQQIYIQINWIVIGDIAATSKSIKSDLRLCATRTRTQHY